MAFGVSAVAWGAIAAGVGVVNAYSQGEEAKKRQEAAQSQALRAADKAATDADQAYNKVNQKKPDYMGLLDANAVAGKGGVGGTMLTGPLGIDPSMLSLGRNTLLGA